MGCSLGGEPLHWERMAPLPVSDASTSTTTDTALEFYKWGFNAQSPPRPQMTQLTRLAKRWLQPEHCSPEQVLEKVVTHHFLQTLPPELQKAVELKEPATTKTMIEATEAAQTVLAMSRASERRPIASWPAGKVPSPFGRKSALSTTELISQIRGKGYHVNLLKNGSSLLLLSLCSPRLFRTVPGRKFPLGKTCPLPCSKTCVSAWTGIIVSYRTSPAAPKYCTIASLPLPGWW
uniref:SCAN box domain-containing protein n=1 Tax=Astyanax mexicanus TaxID=7994 RepID=A0A3B1IU80_ASTMX